MDAFTRNTCTHVHNGSQTEGAFNSLRGQGQQRTCVTHIPFIYRDMIFFDPLATPVTLLQKWHAALCYYLRSMKERKRLKVARGSK